MIDKDPKIVNETLTDLIYSLATKHMLKDDNTDLSMLPLGDLAVNSQIQK